MKNQLLFLLICLIYSLNVCQASEIERQANAVSQLQKQVDEAPSFENVAAYLAKIFETDTAVKTAPYLALLEEFVTSQHQKAQLDYLTVRQLLANNQMCEAQTLVHTLEKYNPDFHLLALNALWQSSDGGVFESEALRCFWKQTRSLMLSRGLLRSQSIYLDIKFELDKSTLSNTSEKQLQALVTSLNSLDLSEFQLVVTGHADEQGSEQYNMALSYNRAATVARYIELNLARKQKLLSLGKGETEPLVKKQGESFYALNRRVEFHLQRINSDDK